MAARPMRCQDICQLQLSKLGKGEWQSSGEHPEEVRKRIDNGGQVQVLAGC